MSALVFVYGSLKRGFHNHRLLEKSNFLGNAEVKGYRMVSLGAFPGIIAAAPDYKGPTIKGELYSVDRPTMASLDRLEGHPHFYYREQVETTLGRAWVYTLPNQEPHISREEVPTGEWRKHGNAA